MGLITADSPLGDATAQSEKTIMGKRGGSRTIRGKVLTVFFYILLLAMLAFSGSVLHWNPLNVFFRDLIDRNRFARLELARDASKINRIIELLEIQHLEKSSYPHYLTELVEAGIAQPREILDRQGKAFVYQSTDDSYTLSIRRESSPREP